MSTSILTIYFNVCEHICFSIIHHFDCFVLFRILIPKCPQILLYIFGVLTTNTCSITFEDIDVIIVNCLPCSYDTTIIFTIATFFIIIITT